MFQIRKYGHYSQYFHFLKKDLNNIETFRTIKKWSFGKILEIGCGIGYISAYLGAEYGIDNNSKVIAVAKKLYPHTAFIVGDSTNLPFKPDQFNTVVCYNVLEHLTNSEIEKTLFEVKRVLKNDGVFLVGYSDLTYWGYHIIEIIKGKDPTHCQRWSRMDFSILIKKFFTVIEKKNTSGYGYCTWLSRFCKGDIVLKCCKN